MFRLALEQQTAEKRRERNGKDVELVINYTFPLTIEAESHS